MATDDIFESALSLEEAHLQEGYQAGVEAGREAGLADGKALGVQRGFEVGHEIGFYSGCVQIWRQLEAKHPGFISARADKTITALEGLLHSFPLDNPKDEGLQDAMAAMQSRYKAAAAMLGLSDASASSQNEGTAY